MAWKQGGEGEFSPGPSSLGEVPSPPCCGVCGGTRVEPATQSRRLCTSSLKEAQVECQQRRGLMGPLLLHEGSSNTQLPKEKAVPSCSQQLLGAARRGWR